MNLIKVGEHFVNLDNVTEVRATSTGVDVYFAGITYAGVTETLEYNISHFCDDEAAALLEWLDGIATDVVEQKRLKDESVATAERWKRLRALGAAHGVTCAPDILVPSFNGTRRGAIFAFSAGQRETFELHAAECGLEADDENFGAWQHYFADGVISAD